MINLIGLGKMGHNLALNFLRQGIDCIGYDANEEARKFAKEKGIRVSDSVSTFFEKTGGPRVVWIMIPAGSGVDDIIESSLTHLRAGDIIIDGGNSHYKDSIRRAEKLIKSGIRYVDCGTSGGVTGALEGLCLMVGGNRDAFEACEPIFKKVCVPGGLLWCGPSGAGHFVKMVHNGIEYGMMAAIGEGFQLLNQSGFNIDHKAVAEVWNHGSVVRGWLMELTARVFEKHKDLKQVQGRINSSGEGRWMVETAIEKNVPVPVISTSLMMRAVSSQEESLSAKIQAALRYEFGGHSVVMSS